MPAPVAESVLSNGNSKRTGCQSSGDTVDDSDVKKALARARGIINGKEGKGIAYVKAKGNGRRAKFILAKIEPEEDSAKMDLLEDGFSLACDQPPPLPHSYWIHRCITTGPLCADCWKIGLLMGYDLSTSVDDYVKHLKEKPEVSKNVCYEKLNTLWKQSELMGLDESIRRAIQSDT